MCRVAFVAAVFAAAACSEIAHECAATTTKVEAIKRSITIQILIVYFLFNIFSAFTIHYTEYQHELDNVGQYIYQGIILQTAIILSPSQAQAGIVDVVVEVVDGLYRLVVFYYYKCFLLAIANEKT